MMKILVVDDEPTCRELLKSVLSPFAKCDLAYDGHEAIGAFRIALDNEVPYDLVCLDIMLPDIDGHEVLRAIRVLEHERGIEGTQGTKVIMTTSVRESKHCVQAFREGCELYLTKPIDPSRLLVEVNRLVGPSSDSDGVIPRAKESAPRESERPKPSSPPDSPARRGRFLIVDDDAVCRALLRDVLSVYADCDFAYDGREAVDAVRLALEDGTPYDLICLDIMMPGMNGHAALETIRKVESQHGVSGLDGAKVIMTTALRDSKHCITAFRAGCESYVTKPIKEQKLLDAMRDLGLLHT